MRTLWLIAAGLCLHAQTTVVLKDGAGRELRRVPATAMPDGSFVLSRGALIGASSAALADSGQESKLVTGDDPEYNLARLWFGGHTEALSFAPIPAEGPLHSPLVETTVEKLFDSPNFGLLYRLQTRKLFPRDGQLLLDDHDRPVAWYDARLVDGQLFAFALPPERLTAIPPVLLGLAEWNSRRVLKFDETYQRAVGYMWVEDYEGAAYYLREAVKLNPKSARAWFHLAFAEGKRGKGNERIACYLKALELDNNIPEAHYNLALAMIMKGDTGGAEAHLAQLYRVQSPLADKLASFVGLIHVDELPAKDARGEPEKL